MTRTVRKLLAANEGANIGMSSRGLYRIFEEQCISDPSRPISESRYSESAIGYVMAGWCDYRAPTGTITAVPGTVVFGNDGEHFDVNHHECQGNRRLVVRYSRLFLQSIAEAYEIDCPNFAIVGLPPGRSALKIFRCLRAIAEGGEGAENAAISLASTALTTKQAHHGSRGFSGRDRRRVMSAVHYVESSFSDSCSIERLASISGYSRYHFIRLFKSITGQSPNQYVISTRLRAAATRLVETRTPVSEIALDVGFNDISHFSAYFRSVFGCSPRQMRGDFPERPRANLRSSVERVILPPGHVWQTGAAWS